MDDDYDPLIDHDLSDEYTTSEAIHKNDIPIDPLNIPTIDRNKYILTYNDMYIPRGHVILSDEKTDPQVIYDRRNGNLLEEPIFFNREYLGQATYYPDSHLYYKLYKSYNINLPPKKLKRIPPIIIKTDKIEFKSPIIINSKTHAVDTIINIPDDLNLLPAKKNQQYKSNILKIPIRYDDSDVNTQIIKHPSFCVLLLKKNLQNICCCCVILFIIISISISVIYANKNKM